MARKMNFIERVEADDSERRALRRFFPQEEIRKIELRLINRELMTKRSYEGCFDPGNCEAQENGRVYDRSNLVLLDNNGDQICVVGMERKAPPNRFWKWLAPEGNPYRCFPECIEKALVRLGDKDAKRVVFVLELDGETLILHRPKKELTLLEWLKVIEETCV